MGKQDEEALQPFLNGHDHESRDASLELPELHHRVIHEDDNDDNDTVDSTLLSSPPSSIGNPSEQLHFVEDKYVLEKPPPPKRPAAYAIAFMLGAQVFSASMNVSIRLLENTSTQLHPLQVRILPLTLPFEMSADCHVLWAALTYPPQILFVRMSVTTLGITAWLWKQHKPSNILGKRENRMLLLVRAFGGFLGVFGLYCMYTHPFSCPIALAPKLITYQTHSGTSTCLKQPSSLS